MMKTLRYWTLAIVTMASLCLAAPEPEIVQGPRHWTVEVTFEHPQQLILPSARPREPRLFWYTIVTLTNKTNRDVDFYPKCELMTDNFQIVPAGKRTPPAVFEQIKKRHETKYPFLESLPQTDDRILQGQDNAKDIAIIWPDFDPRAQAVELFITGLSNETAVIDHPITKDEDGQPEKVYLRKTLGLSYGLRGDPALRSDIKLHYKAKRWIMR
ncbi:MAG: hypothetical protein ACYTEX_20990 [Planctomycetota bacterium]